jgi:DNA polymerase lambda
VTHIVTDAPKNSTLRALGYSRLSDIPDHIPTVKWDWILSAIGRPGQLKEDIMAKMEEVWYYAAFSERMETSASHGRALKLRTDHGKTPKSPTAGASTA